MNFKPSITSTIKPLLLVLAVAALTVFFIYSQVMRYSLFIPVLFLVLIAVTLLSKRYSVVHPHIIKILLLSILVYVSLDYGIFFPRAKYTQLIGFFSAILLPVIFFYPRLMTYFNLALMLFFPSSLYGVSLQHGASKVTELIVSFGGLFSRGASKWGISYVNILLILTAISIMFRMIIKKQDDDGHISCNLYKYFWTFNALFFIYILWGINLRVGMMNILSSRGVINITNLGILVFIMHRMFRTEKDFEQLKMFFLSSMIVRGVWSVFRFIFFGGDIRNPYANFEAMKAVKISIFDIGDGVIQCIALFYALFMLLNMGDRILSKKASFFYWMIASIGLFNILFSYRRTAWFGLLIAFAWLMLNLRAEKRIVAGLIGIIVILTIFTGVAASRFTDVEKRKQGIFYDVATKKGDIKIKEGRFEELYAAWNTIKDNLLFGLGPWGKYNVVRNEQKELSDMTHSSVFHMLLKMGIIGLFIFILIFYGYIHFWLTKRNEIPLHVRGFAEACFAGFLFFVPGILWGTPIVEYRHMLLLGFCLSMPYIIYHINKSQNKAVSPV